MYIFPTEYIFLNPKDQTNEHEQKKQMNHKNEDVHIYSKYRLVFIFLYVFNNIYTHHKHLKIKKTKTKKDHKIVKKTPFFLKKKDLYTVPTSRKLRLSRLQN